jgi:DNA-binding beta-propeller fold protein YncE
VHGERLFIADVGLRVVHMLDLAERSHQTLRGSPSDPFQVPIDVIALPDGTVAVVDRGRAAIDLLDGSGRWRTTLRADEMQAPSGAAYDVRRGHLWVTDVMAHACLAWKDQRLEKRLGGRGVAPGELNFPSAVACDPNVGLVVADAMNFRVQVFDGADQLTLVFGQKGDAAGDFANPRDVAVDSEQHIYVLDNQFENVQIFDTQGRLLMAFGEGGTGPGEFALPSGITIDRQDRIWIADRHNRRVQVFQYLREGG